MRLLSQFQNANTPKGMGYEVEAALWPSRDPIGMRGGLNLYGFVGNDGVNGWDVLGLVLVDIGGGPIAPANTPMVNPLSPLVWNPSWDDPDFWKKPEELIYVHVTRTSIGICYCVNADGTRVNGPAKLGIATATTISRVGNLNFRGDRDLDYADESAYFDSFRNAAKQCPKEFPKYEESSFEERMSLEYIESGFWTTDFDPSDILEPPKNWRPGPLTDPYGTVPY